MCDPVSLLIMAGTKAASTYAQNQAQKAVEKRRSGVIAETNRDLGKFAAESRKEYKKSFDASTPEAIAAAMEQTRLARTADYQAGLPEPTVIVPELGSDAAKRAIANALMQGTAYNRDMAARRAAAESYGVASGNRDIAMKRAGAGIGIQGSFADGRTRLSELELAEAESAGNKWANIAGLIDAVGTVAGGAYSAGMFGAPAAVNPAMASTPKIAPMGTGGARSYYTQQIYT